jgi:PKD repeat protein
VAVIEGPATAPVSQTVLFKGSGSSDNDDGIKSYAWDFGDGTSSTEAEPTHTYTLPGPYTVVLTVTDNGGLTASAEHFIQITEVAIGDTPAALPEQIPSN